MKFGILLSKLNILCMEGKSALATTGCESHYVVLIQDEEVPLASNVPTGGASFFLWTVVALLMMAAVVVTAVYISQCMKYRKRYLEMLKQENADQKVPKIGWSLSTLKALVDETENRLAEQML